MNIVDIAYSRRDYRKISVIYSSDKGNYSEEKEFGLPFLLVKSTISKSDLEKIRYEYRGESKTPESVKEIMKILRGEPVDMFKVCTSIPIEIPALKRKLLDQGLEVFEADIPYLFRVGLDNKLNYYEKVMPKILAFDIETDCSGNFPDAEKDSIISISYYGDGLRKVTTYRDFKTEGDYIHIVKNESEMLKDFCKTINNSGVDVITGYNSDGFDLPFIKTRAKLLNVKLELGPLKSGIKLERAGRRGNSARIPGLTHFDSYIFVRNILSSNLKTNSLKLDDVAHELTGHKKEEQLGAFVSELWKEGSDKNLNRIMRYNLHDSRITWKLAEKMMPIAIQFVRIVGIPLFDVSRMRYGRLVEQYIIKNSIDENRIIENKPSESEISIRMKTKIMGAFVYQPIPGVYKNIRVFDFRSLYPSIIIAHNIDPYTLSEDGENEINLPHKTVYFKNKGGFIPDLLRNLLEKRSEIKSKLKNVDSDSEMGKELDAQSYAIKILANSFYGYLGFYGARWYSIDCAAAVTAMGRKYIDQVMKTAIKYDIKVIYGDTDSVFLIDSPNINAFEQEVNASLPNPMELEDEGIYVSGIFLEKKGSDAGAKKRYALLDKNGKIIVKGLESRRGDWSKIAKNAQLDVLNTVLLEGSGEGALNIVQKIIKNIRDKKFDIDDLILSNKLSRNLEDYVAIGPQVAAGRLMAERGEDVGPGTIVKYIITEGNSKLVRDRVKLSDTVSIDEIDEDYYINKQVIGATYKILELFGYTEDQIRGLNTELDQWL